jgi:predicted DNA-binding transcriptional regulator AlpA
MEGQKEFLSRSEAAELLGLRKQTLANYLWRGNGPPVTKLSPRCVRYNRTALLKWAESITVDPGQQAAKFFIVAEPDRRTASPPTSKTERRRP